MVSYSKVVVKAVPMIVCKMAVNVDDNKIRCRVTPEEAVAFDCAFLVRS